MTKEEAEDLAEAIEVHAVAVSVIAISGVDTRRARATLARARAELVKRLISLHAGGKAP